MREQGLTAGTDVAIGVIEVARPPGVGDIANGAVVQVGARAKVRVLRDVGEQLHALVCGVSREDAAERPLVVLVHVDDEVPVAILGRSNAAGTMLEHGDANGAQLVDGAVMRWVAVLLVARTRRVDDELVGEAGTGDEIDHDELRHGRSADVSETNEQDAVHGAPWARRTGPVRERCRRR